MSPYVFFCIQCVPPYRSWRRTSRPSKSPNYQYTIMSVRQLLEAGWRGRYWGGFVTVTMNKYLRWG
jgi:hypothetical protein